MDDHELAKLVDAWIKGTLFGRDERGRATPIHDENWWALERLLNWKHDNEPELLWRFILAVHEKDTSEELAGHLAAGPVEDLMSEFGEAYIERIEDLARRDERFKRMLSCTWQDAMSDDLWTRFQRARSG
jgi:hypothetical protein